MPMKQKNLVIVESPAKAKTIEGFLGSDYKVLSSYGHIRDLEKKDFGINLETFEPQYEVSADKHRVVAELRAAAQKADTVWLASDEDREGEAIAWHLAEVLGLDAAKTNRIVFHEITKTAIANAIAHPRQIDLALVDAQQARRVLDRLVGFKLSPVLWHKVKPSLSAGRVQSVTVRLLVEREREINAFVTMADYRVVAQFAVMQSDGSMALLRARYGRTFPTETEAEAFLLQCSTSSFYVEDIKTNPSKRSPAAPFTTSTLQQEAARRLGFSVSSTMRLAQELYEAGLITYMRTDSVNLSAFALASYGQVVVETMGEAYHKRRNYATKSKGAQEAHEAIRPTDAMRSAITGMSTQAQRLYDLIYKRTIASQMADAQLEKTTISISAVGIEGMFQATGEVIKFDGFMRVYRVETDSEADDSLLPAVQVGQSLAYDTITATERFTAPPARYTEASLVHKLEELGIGRPSTYAPTIKVIQDRGYAYRGEQEGTPRSYAVLTLTQGQPIAKTTATELAGSNKGKLVPSDIGAVVNDFLMDYFPEVLDYNFTANVEQQFDEVAEGKREWTGMIRDFYDYLEPKVAYADSVKTERRVGERLIGTHPDTGKPVYAKITRFGPCVQVGDTDSEEKPQFSSIPKTLSIETITLAQALDLFKLPRIVGEFEGKEMRVNAGRFGPYVQHDGKFASLPKGTDLLAVTYDEAVAALMVAREKEANRVIKTLMHEGEPLEVLNGQYGPYIAYAGSNYRLTKEQREVAHTLTLEQCVAIVTSQEGKPARSKRTAGQKTKAKASDTKKAKATTTKKTTTSRQSTKA
ncbi:MAG: type I DNA topoisomerase [Bacteroidales bacterium]|nr:type I DNA topoisomerase [Bacteroidales bacterium]